MYTARDNQNLHDVRSIARRPPPFSGISTGEKSWLWVVEKLLSSAAKIVFLIIHQLRLYTGLMTNSTSYLFLVNSFSKGMLSLQTQESLSELG